MNIFQYLNELQVDIKSKSTKEIESKYFDICAELAGIERAEKIRQVDTNNYVDSLKMGLEKSFIHAKNTNAPAIYFEYDLDNNWDSSFFICEVYSLLEEQDDDWACDWDKEIEGPSLQMYGEIYELDGFSGSEAAIGTTIYLVARTILSFIEAYESLGNESSIAVCIAFHDQDPIMRIKE